ncbi:unnamed protein product [Diamesa tonsa]
MKFIAIVLFILTVRCESKLCQCDQCIKNGNVHVNSTFEETAAFLGEPDIGVAPVEASTIENASPVEVVGAQNEPLNDTSAIHVQAPAETVLNEPSSIKKDDLHEGGSTLTILSGSVFSFANKC